MTRAKPAYVLLLAIIVLITMSTLTITRVKYYANQEQVERSLSEKFIRQAGSAIRKWHADQGSSDY